MNGGQGALGGSFARCRGPPGARLPGQGVLLEGLLLLLAGDDVLVDLRFTGALVPLVVLGAGEGVWRVLCGFATKLDSQRHAPFLPCHRMTKGSMRDNTIKIAITQVLGGKLLTW